MTIAVYWDVKHQNKQTNKLIFSGLILRFNWYGDVHVMQRHSVNQTAHGDSGKS